MYRYVLIALQKNTMFTNDIDLMSPVGSFESLMAAIQAGATSVYFGVGKLNMRSRSAINFTLNDLQEISRICGNHKLRTYLTVNTVIYDDEIDEMHELIIAAKNNNISAIIASDMAVVEYARSNGIEVHASTQLNISNFEAVKFFSQWCDVMVLARELSLKQVAEINRKITEQQVKGPSGNLIKTEIFVHGALCMAVSGKCYLSLHEFNKSANRGECFQTCRRAYEVFDKETGYQLEIDNEYIMSPKDLNTIGFLNKILNAGVKVLKIEGRARAPEYVKTVTQCYREAINACFDGTYSDERIHNWNKRLTLVFNRGFWNGYYLGQPMGEWSMHYGSSASRTKKHIGKCSNYFSKSKVAEFIIETPDTLMPGETILIIGPTTGVVEIMIDEIRVDDQPVHSVERGVRFSVKLFEPVRRNDKLYKYISTGK